MCGITKKIKSAIILSILMLSAVSLCPYGAVAEPVSTYISDDGVFSVDFPPESVVIAENSDAQTVSSSTLMVKLDIVEKQRFGYIQIARVGIYNDKIDTLLESYAAKWVQKDYVQKRFQSMPSIDLIAQDSITPRGGADKIYVVTYNQGESYITDTGRAGFRTDTFNVAVFIRGGDDVYIIRLKAPVSNYVNSSTFVLLYQEYLLSMIVTFQITKPTVEEDVLFLPFGGNKTLWTELDRTKI